MLSPRASLFSSSSYLGSRSETPTHTPSPTSGASQAPTNPLPEGQSRPSDVVVNRLHEVKRITKSLVAYFEGISSAHTTHSTTLLKLSSPSIIQSPLPESSLFLPTPPTPNGGQMGWADLLSQIRDNNKQVAEEHAELAKTVTKNVVLPLKKLRVELKSHIGAMEKEVSKLADGVIKERQVSLSFQLSLICSYLLLLLYLSTSEITSIHLATLSRSLSPPSTPAGLSSPQISNATHSSDDPYLHKVTTEQQLKAQTTKENELLKVVLGWQDKSEQLEKAVWEKVAGAWRTWSETNPPLRQRRFSTSRRASSLFLPQHFPSTASPLPNSPALPQAEWNHFKSLNHILPRDTPPTVPEEIDFIGKDDLMTASVREGLMERQKRFVKTWKSAYFILTPSGNLHEYPSQDVPLNKPSVSLHLPSCTLGPMPTPEPSAKGRPIEAMFTIEGDGSRNVFRAKSWEELSTWWLAIERYTKVAPIPLASPPLDEQDEGNGDIGHSGNKAVPALPEEGEEGLITSPELPVRSLPSFPPSLLSHSLRLARARPLTSNPLQRTQATPST
ncbi:hypothetical protein P7C70_g7726, partial [Phenoliferia sp. Uapishka_3]